MPSEAYTAGSGEETLQFSDAASCRAWLGRLAREDLVECHERLSMQAELLAHETLRPATKLGILEQLRETVAELQASYARICWGRPVPLEDGDQAIWESVVALWRSMAAGYDALILEIGSGAQDIAGQAALICQRALRYTGLAMGEHNRVYRAVSGELWKQLHRLYVFAENAGVATAAVNDPVGRSVAATSCAGTYVHALLAQLAQPDALGVRNMDLVDRWLDRWESLVMLSPEPLRESAIPALAVDVTAAKGVGFARELPAAGVRHISLEALSKTVRQAVASLQQNQTPAQLGLGEMPRDACEQLLLLLHLQWCAAGTGRMDERSPADIRVMISATIPSIHFHLTGRAFRQPGREMTARERLEMDRLGFVSDGNEQAMASQRSAAVEMWVIVNKSTTGFLGLCRDPRTGSRITHNQLLGLKAGPAQGMFLGIVQRLSVDEQGAVWAGLRVISSSAEAVAARLVEAAAHDGGPYDRALLLPEDKARQVPVSIVLLPGWYAPGRIVEVHTGRTQKISLQALLDRGPNFARAAYTAA